MSNDIKPGDWVLCGSDILHRVKVVECVVYMTCGVRIGYGKHFKPKTVEHEDQYGICKKCKKITGDDRLTKDHTPEEAEVYYAKYPEKLIWPGKKT